MKTSEKNFSNLFLLKIFILLVGALVLVSLISKGIALFSNRNFDGPSFTLLVSTPNAARIIYLDREFKSINIFSVLDIQVNNNSTLKNSLNFMIPIDGIIVIKNSDAQEDLFSAGHVIRLMMDRNVKLSGLNNFDLVQMYFFAKSVRKSDIILTTIKKEVFESGEGSSLLFDSVKNENIINERKDVEIYNATEIDGFGGKVAQMLKNEGFNVVITKSKEKSKVSEILFKEDKSNTSDRLEKIFSIAAQQQTGNSIADITIVIGDDIGSKIGN
jgi:hypothetical protein